MTTAGGREAWVRTVAAGALLVAVTVIAYTPAFRAGYVWDDEWHITENHNLRSTEGLWRVWFRLSRPYSIVTPQYYPLTHTTFWVEYQLWGLDPVGYHAVNVLLHALSAVLLWLTLRRLRIPGAWVAAAVWALHPVMVESVAWATERKNVLSGVFYWAAFLAYIRFDGLDEVEPRPRRWGWYAAALAAFGCALLGKTVTSTLPAAVLVVRWWKRGTISARDVWPLGPFFLFAAAMGSLTSWMERHVVGAAGEEWHFTVADRVLIAGRAICFYAAKLVAPVGLAFNYERWVVDPGVLWQWAFPMAVVAATAALLALRGRIGRGPLAAWLFFVGTLVPALGFVDFFPMRFSFVADHFQYLAAVGLIVLAVGAAATATRSAPPAARAALAGGVLVVLGALTVARTRVFHDVETLWFDTLRKNPRSWLAHLNLEEHYRRQGKIELALDEAREAAALRPMEPRITSRIALDLSLLDRRADARAEHGRAIELGPKLGAVHYNFAEDLVRWGELESAEREYRTATRVEPELPGPRHNLGLLLAARGDLAGAEALYRQELEIDPDAPRTLTSLANVQLRSGNSDGAEQTLERALRLDPDFAVARNTLAIILFRRGDTAGAEREARRALDRDPGLAEAHNTLGNALVTQGRLDEAIAAYQAALRLRPGLTQAQANLDLAIERKRQAGAGR